MLCGLQVCINVVGGGRLDEWGGPGGFKQCGTLCIIYAQNVGSEYEI